MIKLAPVLVLLIASSWPSASAGQGTLSLPVICRSAPFVENHLRQNFQEQVIGKGSSGGGATAELWVSKGGETWSFLIRIQGSYICLVRSGRHWKEQIDGIPIRGQENG